MTNTKDAFELNGALYVTTGKGYYYRTIGTDMRRVSRAVYEQAWDELIATVNAADENWEEEVVAPKKKADEKKAEDDKTTEKRVAKKAEKRPSKDIAHVFEQGDNMITLTAKQVDFIKHLPDTCFWEHGLDSEIWTDCLCDEIGGQFEDKPMTVGAMISTLCEKKLGVRSKTKVNGRKCTSFALTDLGKKVASELGVK